MTTTLQRSSYSFRRQGSSGRIWDNRLEIPELKGGCDHPCSAVAVHEKTRRQGSTSSRFNHNEISNSNPSASTPEIKKHPSVNLSRSRSERKVQRCAFISIFGRCAGSPAS